VLLSSIVATARSALSPSPSSIFVTLPTETPEIRTSDWTASSPASENGTLSV
jgi:hypothetical protein